MGFCMPWKISCVVAKAVSCVAGVRPGGSFALTAPGLGWHLRGATPGRELAARQGLKLFASCFGNRILRRYSEYHAVGMHLTPELSLGARELHCRIVMDSLPAGEDRLLKLARAKAHRHVSGRNVSRARHRPMESG